MKKFFMALAFAGALFMTSCGNGGVDGQLDKLDKMIEEQNELAETKGYKSDATVNHMRDLYVYAEELQKEMSAENSEWTQEQKDRFIELSNKRISGRESTMEEMNKN